VDAHLHDCVEVDDTEYIWFILVLGPFIWGTIFVPHCV
jgi:hypothetical protein